MQDQMTPRQILQAGGEVADSVLKHTSKWVEAVNILRAAQAAIAGGLNAVQADRESLEHPAATP